MSIKASFKSEKVTPKKVDVMKLIEQHEKNLSKSKLKLIAPIENEDLEFTNSENSN